MNGEAGLDVGATLFTFGALFVAGLAADALGRRTRIPRVSLLLLVGLAVGGAGLDLIPEQAGDWYELAAAAALTMVAFVLGGSLKPERLRANGRRILLLSASVTLGSVLIVGGGLLALGAAPALALALAGLATATDPAATQDVARQSGADGPFADTILGVVAIDDAWGLLAFSLLMVLAGGATGTSESDALLAGLWEIGGALALGLAIGFPAAALSGRLRPGEPLLVEALAAVFLTAGAAMALGVSFLLAGIAVGAVVANFAPHHSEPIHEIEGVEWPFLILFFVLAGATFRPGALVEAGWLAAAYVLLRLAGRLAAGWAGGALAGLSSVERRWAGPALLPQAGVAIGMALVAADRFPVHGETIVSVAVATTVVFEVLGPLAAQRAFARAAN